MRFWAAVLTTATVYCTASVSFSDGLLSKLPPVQNAAARVVTGTRKFDHYYSGAASTSLASGTAANHLQVGDDHLQMPSRSSTVLPGWRVYPRGSCGWHSSCRVQGLRSVGETLLCQARWHGTASPRTSTLSTHTFTKRLKNNLFGC